MIIWFYSIYIYYCAIYNYYNVLYEMLVYYCKHFMKQPASHPWLHSLRGLEATSVLIHGRTEHTVRHFGGCFGFETGKSSLWRKYLVVSLHQLAAGLCCAKDPASCTPCQCKKHGNRVNIMTEPFKLNKADMRMQGSLRLETMPNHYRSCWCAVRGSCKTFLANAFNWAALNFATIPWNMDHWSITKPSVRNYD